MERLFNSSGYQDAGSHSVNGGDSIDIASLPPFLRVLLTTDGTVTKSLESFFWEPVNVVNLGQKYVQLDEPVPALDLLAGAKVLHRQVKLLGSRSQEVYTSADSYIRAEILDQSVRQDLEAGKVGVGELLRELGLETYREIVGFGESQDLLSIWRRYRIIMNHQPFIQITETFPLKIFQ